MSDGRTIISSSDDNQEIVFKDASLITISFGLDSASPRALDGSQETGYVTSTSYDHISEWRTGTRWMIRAIDEDFWAFLCQGSEAHCLAIKNDQLILAPLTVKSKWRKEDRTNRAAMWRVHYEVCRGRYLLPNKKGGWMAGFGDNLWVEKHPDHDSHVNLLGLTRIEPNPAQSQTRLP